MKFSEQWLREWVNPNIPTEELAQQLTMAGLEVDGVDPVATAFTGVVMAEIESAEQHPDADKLRVCQVNTGTETVQVVCGAPNARRRPQGALRNAGRQAADAGRRCAENQKGQAAWCRVLQGMLCAEQELGMAESSDGLMELAADAPVGTDIPDYLDLDDTR